MSKRNKKNIGKNGNSSKKVIKKAVAKAKAKNKAKTNKRKPAPASQGAPKGNQFWMARSSHGRDPIFKTSFQLWKACCEYFQWAEDNPLKEGKVFHTDGKLTYADVNKMRAMTISGMCIFLDICEDTWANYRKRIGFLGVTTRAEKIIYNQKFAGASADLLNANIIARDLGLADKKEFKVKAIIGEMNVEDMTDEQLQAELDRRD